MSERETEPSEETVDSSIASHANLLHFLIELRRRILRWVFVTAILLLITLYFANNLYSVLALPLLKHIPQGHLIATQIGSSFFVPFKLAFVVALILSVPYFLYQLWGFVAPALYDHERRLLWPLLLTSTFLFYAGMAFAYFVIFPLLFGFFAKTTPQGVMLSPDIGLYLDMTLKLLFIFGLLFEVPVAMMLLVWSGAVTPERLVKIRGYAIVGAFVIGMLLAPPDVFSQTLLAVPLWILYEVGIILSRFFVRKVG